MDQGDENKPGSGSSGEHLLNLPSPVRPISSSPAPGGEEEPEIDPEKLLKAWEASVSVQLELIRVVEKNEQANIDTRKDNARTRKFVAVMVFAGLACVCIATGLMMRHTRSLLEDAEHARELRIKTDENVRATLRAVRATAVAVGAKVEADAMLTPHAEEKALKAGVQSQTVALEAEKQASDTPAEKHAVDVKLQEVRQKARVLKIDVNNGDAATPEKK